MPEENLDFEQFTLPPSEDPSSNIELIGADSVVTTGSLKSPNYRTAQTGWTINSDGSAEFRSVTIAGYTLTNKGSFGGDGSDGDKTVSASETLNPTYQVFNYKNLTIDASQTLDFGSNFLNKIIIIKVQQNLILNGTIDASGMGQQTGGTGGAGGAQGTNGTAGGLGNEGARRWETTVCGGAGGGKSDTSANTGGGGGGQGAGHKVAGSDGTAGTSATGAGGTGGTGNGSAYGLQYLFDANWKNMVMATGASGGGGGGAGGDNGGGAQGGTGGAGGKGGGAIYIEVAGNITTGASSTITVAGGTGSVGTAGANNSGGGGGGAGGSGGHAVILYNGTYTGGGLTTTVSGGSGGAGGAAAGSGGAGGAGGNGGAGDSIIQENTIFA